VRTLSLSTVLAVLWLGLSGHYTPLLLAFGLASALLVVYIGHRMGTLDKEGHPTHLILGAIRYWPWLIKEIVKANIDVAKIVLARDLPISPTVATLKASQRSVEGRVTYANSITLTPGTVTLRLDGDRLEVHGLTREGIEALETAEMDRRVVEMEAGR
jgi:multicomponent Na+:H+ antiporter subunit E